jgi:hypothetical protein
MRAMKNNIHSPSRPRVARNPSNTRTVPRSVSIYFRSALVLQRRDFTLFCLILRGSFDIINNEDFHWTFCRFQLEPELFLKGGED